VACELRQLDRIPSGRRFNGRLLSVLINEWMLRHTGFTSARIYFGVYESSCAATQIAPFTVGGQKWQIPDCARTAALQELLHYSQIYEIRTGDHARARDLVACAPVSR
jgi:hypothetical protein